MNFLHSRNTNLFKSVGFSANTCFSNSSDVSKMKILFSILKCVPCGGQYSQSGPLHTTFNQHQGSPQLHTKVCCCFVAAVTVVLVLVTVVLVFVAVSLVFGVVEC